jgi:hypothetical protein
MNAVLVVLLDTATRCNRDMISRQLYAHLVGKQGEGNEQHGQQRHAAGCDAGRDVTVADGCHCHY